MNNDETKKILKDILKWQRLQGIEILKKNLKEENLFSDKKHVLAYYYSDGNRSLREIEKLSGVGFRTVQALWKKWVDRGIAEPTERYGGGRCKRLFDLSEFGLELPVENKRENKE